MASSAMARAKDFLRRRNERAKNSILAVRMAGEAFGAASIAGYARGRFTDSAMQIGGVDVELGGGLVALGLGVTGVLGRSVSPDLIAVGTGLLCNYGTIRFLTMGEEHRMQDVATAGRQMGVGNVSPIGSARPQQRVAR